MQKPASMKAQAATVDEDSYPDQRSRCNAFYRHHREPLGDITNMVVRKQTLSEHYLGYVDDAECEEECKIITMANKVNRRPIEMPKQKPLRDANAEVFFGSNPEGRLREMIKCKLEAEAKLVATLAPRDSPLGPYDLDCLKMIVTMCQKASHSIDTQAIAMTLFHQVLAFRGQARPDDPTAQ